MIDLQSIRARCHAATPGPWRIEKIGRFPDHDECVVSIGNETIDCSAFENAEFIAHARKDIPALIAEVERLSEEARKVFLLCKKKETENAALRRERDVAVKGLKNVQKNKEEG